MKSTGTRSGPALSEQLHGIPSNGNGATPVGENVTLEQKFDRRLEAIFQGARTPIDKLNHPRQKFSAVTMTPIGTLQDPIARELFSYSVDLQNQMNALPIPRIPEDEQEFQIAREIFGMQIVTVNYLFSNRLSSAFPRLNEELVQPVVCQNWKIGALKETIQIDSPHKFATNFRSLFSKRKSRP